MKQSLLVNSDTAVSVAHSVFLVGRYSCHMKKTSAFALAFMLAACEKLVA